MQRLLAWIDRCYETFSIYKAVLVCPEGAVATLQRELRRRDYPCGTAWDDERTRLLCLGEGATWPRLDDVNFVLLVNTVGVDAEALLRETRAVVVCIQCPTSFLELE